MIELQRVALDCALSPAQVLARLSAEPLPFALTGSWAGGGAILGCRPLTVASGATNPFAVLDKLPAPPPGRTPEGAVGGGWFGWLGYQLSHLVEQIPPGPPRPVMMPTSHLAYYDHVLHLDAAGQWWFEALAGVNRRSAVSHALRRLRGLLDGPPPPRTHGDPAPFVLSAGAAADHLEAVRECRARIAAGEIFQANLCVRLQSRWDGTAAELLSEALTRVSPAYGAAFDTPGGGVASLSPELFLRRQSSEVTTAPIKGTAVREVGPAGAAALAQLLASAKDAAEHVMIVDLMRNDLGRVCEYGSIRAPRGPTADAHPGLWHLVSRVRGRLRPGVGHEQLLGATFPPGSVTGAPKVQALHVIADLESTGREVYTGAIGYASPLAGLELNVAIRTLELRRGQLWLGAGGGIVSDSDPEAELAEALAKARPVAAAVGSTVAVNPLSARPAPPRVATVA